MLDAASDRLLTPSAAMATDPAARPVSSFKRNSVTFVTMARMLAI